MFNIFKDGVHSGRASNVSHTLRIIPESFDPSAQLRGQMTRVGLKYSESGLAFHIALQTPQAIVVIK